MMDRTLYLRCAAGEVAGRVLLTGDPARVERIAAAMDDARLVAHNREFITMTGSLRGVPFSVISSGIGGASPCGWSVSTGAAVVASTSG